VYEKFKNVFVDTTPALRWLAAIVAVGQAVWALYNFLLVHIFDFKMPSYTDVGRGALFVHAITVLLLIGTPTFLPPLRKKPEFENAIAASKQFVHLWYFVWAGFFALYAIWFYYWPEISTGNESLAVHLAVDFLNSATSALLFLCYLVMVLRTVPPAKFGWFHVIFWVFLFVVVFIFAEGLTAEYFPDEPGTFGKQAYFDAVQGLLSGVGIALLVGRLESRRLNRLDGLLLPFMLTPYFSSRIRY
jgi:hypothetical protein